jgi:endoglucanase Acf2
VITINDQNFNFFNGHSWTLKVFKALDENKDELDLESASEEEEGK